MFKFSDLSQKLQRIHLSSGCCVWKYYLRNCFMLHRYSHTPRFSRLSDSCWQMWYIWIYRKPSIAVETFSSSRLRRNERANMLFSTRKKFQEFLRWFARLIWAGHGRRKRSFFWYDSKFHRASCSLNKIFWAKKVFCCKTTAETVNADDFHGHLHRWSYDRNLSTASWNNVSICEWKDRKIFFQHGWKWNHAMPPSEGYILKIFHVFSLLFLTERSHI